MAGQGARPEEKEKIKSPPAAAGQALRLSPIHCSSPIKDDWPAGYFFPIQLWCNLASHLFWINGIKVLHLTNITHVGFILLWPSRPCNHAYPLYTVVLYGSNSSSRCLVATFDQFGPHRKWSARAGWLATSATEVQAIALAALWFDQTLWRFADILAGRPELTLMVISGSTDLSRQHPSRHPTVHRVLSMPFASHLFPSIDYGWLYTASLASMS